MKWIDHNTCPMTVGMMDGLQEEITSVHNRLMIIDWVLGFFVAHGSEGVQWPPLTNE